MFYCPIALGIQKKKFKVIVSDNNKTISEMDEVL